jgi:hypothetical protein
MPGCGEWSTNGVIQIGASLPSGASPPTWKASFMATLVLTALGTAVGGPIGGLIGGLIGQQADALVFGDSKTRQGPRLRELAFSTSSYGQPIPRQFGRMRVPGTVIWSTDLIESTNKQGGGKGQPSTTTYSYTASFAVALSSTPIMRVGRIWADGNLLRGALDDLKVGGTMRLYCGHGDDPVDPLIAAAKGARATGFRDSAYVVFEGLELADFGNRIPALSFEIFADDGEDVVCLDRLVPDAALLASPAILPGARGFADEGGPLAGSLAAIDQVIPLVCTSGSDGLVIAPRAAPAASAMTLPAQLSLQDGASDNTRHKARAGIPVRAAAALRYYDEDRDYQPGVQRAIGSRGSGRELMIDLPATMTASGARQLANDSAVRARWQHETVVWRMGELDPRITPGVIVRIPDAPGHWLVRSWEWLDRGIELDLERLAPGAITLRISDPGENLAPVDLVVPATSLAAFEVPAHGATNPNLPLMFAAASAENSAWRGAALFVVQGTGLIDLGTTGSQRAVIGTLAEPLAPSKAQLFEARSDVIIELVADDLAFVGTDGAGLIAGANRLLIGSEVIQFAEATPLGGRQWRLSGLLRGRGGTEDAAAEGHPAQTTAVLLDDRLIALDHQLVPPLAGTQIAALGTGDADAVLTPLANPGLSRRPPCPVHPRINVEEDQARVFRWTRRGRGQWRWDHAVEVPLVEERELYLVGYGPPETPHVAWSRSEPSIRLTASEVSALTAAYGPGTLWVRQIGTFDQSRALLLATLS